MLAMRESLAWHCLRDPNLASVCLQARCAPRDLRFYPDLSRIPWAPDSVHSPQQETRDLRRLSKVASNTLCDLGWSRPRRRHPVRPDPLELPIQEPSESPLLARCSAGAWHLPRVIRWHNGRCYTPCFASRSLLSWLALAAPQPGLCRCGRGGQWFEDPFTNS
jgi:hypothetical protein